MLTGNYAKIINYLKEHTTDGEEWITINGAHVLIEGDEAFGYQIKGGGGGKFNGQRVTTANIKKKQQLLLEGPKSREAALLSGHERLEKPLIPVKETAKAYGVPKPGYREAQETAEYDLKELSGSQIEMLRNGNNLIWLPKSQVTYANGQIHGMPRWLAEKNNLWTSESARAAEAKEAEMNASYEKLVQEAKSLGVKGARKGLKVRTLQKMIREHKE